MSSRTSRFIRRQVYRKGFKGPRPEIAREDRQYLSDKLRQALGKRSVRVKRQWGLK